MPHTASTIQRIPRVYVASKQNELGEEITDVITDGTVTYDSRRLIPFSLSMAINDDLIDPYTDCIAPFLTVRYSDGYEETSQLGLFLVLPPKATVTQQVTRNRYECPDLIWLLANDVFDSGYTVEAGTNYVSAVSDILETVGITRRAIPATSLETEDSISWKPGTTKIDVVNDLLRACGMYPLSTLKDGRVASKPIVSLKNLTPSVIYSTGAARTSRVRVVRHIEIDPMPERVFNKVVVIRDNASKDPIVATRINEDPSSPISTTSLGLTIAQTFRINEIADQTAAQLLAQRYLDEAGFNDRRLKLVTTPDVNRDFREIYELRIAREDGQDLFAGAWFCTGWKLGFMSSNPLMEHELIQVEGS